MDFFNNPEERAFDTANAGGWFCSWLLIVIPALSRNPFSSADGTGHAPSFPPRGYRIPALRGNEAVATPPGEKSKWIPA